MTLDFLRIEQVVVLVFGLVIIYFASKGYRRTKSRSLLLLAIGFAMVSVGAVLAGVLFELLNVDLLMVDTIQAAAQAVGFFIIVFSLAAVRD